LVENNNHNKEYQRSSHSLSLLFWPLCFLSFFDLRLLITPLVSSDYLFGIFWIPLWYLLITVSSDYPFGIFWLPLWYLLNTPLVSSDYGIFWLPLWYLLITPLVSSNLSELQSMKGSGWTELHNTANSIFNILRSTVNWKRKY
jgi:hypothetical protein